MKGTDITHNYSVGGASLNATPVAGYSILDNSFRNDLSVEFVGNRVFSTRSARSASSVAYYGDNTIGTVSYSGGRVISTRLSDNTWRSFATGAGSGGRVASGSFVSAHSQVAAGMQLDMQPKTYAAAEGTTGNGRPTGGATGELNPEFASPVGDVLLPLLLMAFVYTVVRFWRNRKLLLRSK